MADEAIRRNRMVDALRKRGIANAAVLDALRAIPRHRFVQEALRGKAYSDTSLPIGDKQTISQPWIVARMSELLEPRGEGRVLEIGTGSGYQAAVLSRLFAQVYSVERAPELSRAAREVLRALEIANVHLKIFDGTYGWQEFAPYRGILVTAAAPEPPRTLLDQLEEGGRLVVPVALGPTDSDRQWLVRVTRRGSGFLTEELDPCRFVPLVGKFGWNP